ncbi:MAG: Restriction modification system DNA specificity domain-containing protein [Candidatus Moranbacteria bacterium GW2011_GWF2_36_839]|nr:MAG: Restriction modification system DNA specificity domain-containing protein [Candidatus Moranbacteria bacterium GW2011_GWF1_36_78]KKQ16928.1 MAG: Restriction modification system DNA specificity domain-containing protein [Candidatus Moranbacteria bacterium GW2011_GWF2_36_839]HAT73638.1 restriction endonuclease subunit S [Candidatus Moranbacteria bacterium]HBY10483.1 restriction endonuclease subunit S [Candidatus Moranbacteria bacterium]
MQKLQLKKEYQKYPEYKNSGVEWLGKIPKEWSARRIKFCIGKMESGSRENVDKNLHENAVPSIGGEHIFNGKIKFKENKYITQEYYNSLHKGKIKSGDILLVKDGATIGKIGIAQELREKMAVNEHVYLIRSGWRTEQKFLYYLLFSPEIQSLISLETRGSAQGGLNTTFTSNIFNTFPPKKDQQKIANFLDEKVELIEKIVQKKKQLIDLLKEKRTAVINQAVTNGLNPNAEMKNSGVEWIGKVPKDWKVQKLKYISNIRTSNVDKKSELVEKRILLCNYVDVYKNNFITSGIDFMKATATDEQIRKFSIKKADVLITKDSESPDDIAIPALVEDELNNVLCGYHLSILRPKENIIKGGYLFRSLQSKKINSQFVISANGITRFGLGAYPIKNAHIPIPQQSEQDKIVEIINEKNIFIDQIINKIVKSINLLTEFKSSLISNVVTGKVRI